MTRGWVSLEALAHPQSSITREYVLDLNDVADALDEAEAEAKRRAEEAAKRK